MTPWKNHKHVISNEEIMIQRLLKDPLVLPYSLLSNTFSNFSIRDKSEGTQVRGQKLVKINTHCLSISLSNVFETSGRTLTDL